MEHRHIGAKVRAHFSGLKFDEPSHTYKKDGFLLTSVSNVIKGFARPFDSDKMSKLVARKEGVSQKEILQRWTDIKDEACSFGTRVHDFGERYVIDRYKVDSDLKFKSVYQHLENGEQLSPKELALIKFWNKKPDFYIPIALELRMFCVALGIAGTADIILLDTRDNSLVIGDYKTNKDLFKQYKDQKLLGIFSDMADTPFSKYKIQLSTYQVLLELTGMKVSRRFLVWLKPDGEFEIFNTGDISGKMREHLTNKKEYAAW